MLARQAANRAAAEVRRAQGLQALEEQDEGRLLHARMTRLLRPKTRRWVLYEWFCSPVDYGW